MINAMTTIGDIAEIYDGPHATPKKINVGPYFLSISSLEKGRLDLSKSAHVSEEQFTKWTKRVTPKENDLLFSYETRLGEAALMPGGVKACLGRRMGLLRAKPNKVHPDYLLYAYLSPFFQNVIKSNTIVGATVNRIALSEMAAFPIRIPSTEEQYFVSTLLKTIDKKIELNNRINAELEAMAKTLYDYWFVQFDFPDVNGKPYKSSGGKMVYSDLLRREIPEGWEAGTISSISDLVRGVTYNKDDITRSDDREAIPILRATNITGNKIDIDDMIYVSKEMVGEKQFLNKFDILITMSSGSINHIGKNGFYYFEERVAFGAFCAKLVAKQDYRYFLFGYTQSDYLKKSIQNECLGTNINNLNASLVKGFKLAIPDSTTLGLFNQKVESIYQVIESTQQESKKLVELRDWLLPMLMNGQVTVK
ncbi:type I restriction enzyme, S subunit [Vibrio crassostreae]|jgi:type I restriction enzyme S subunit|nr:type I restriction enzyme, S subunit [Vibrio crassostreae]CAK3690278.1 type I restriction enzyme, S subunit [Vibrio crassostreae]